MVVSVRLTCVEGFTELRHPWCCAVDSATDVGALSSGRDGLTAGCTWNVPGCRAFGLLLRVHVGSSHLVGVLGDAGGCAGGAATSGTGVAPALLHYGAEW